jgi:hypothetical protein
MNSGPQTIAIDERRNVRRECHPNERRMREEFESLSDVCLLV